MVRNYKHYSDSIVKKEALLWKLKWETSNETPRTFIDSLQLCSNSLFPNIYNILKVCATLPVTVATVERSFSTLKRIKTYLRNTTEEKRLNGLALMSIHREIEISVSEVLDKFCEKNRKLFITVRVSFSQNFCSFLLFHIFYKTNILILYTYIIII